MGKLDQSILDEALAQQGGPGGTGCKVGKILYNMSEEVRAAFTALLSNPVIWHTTITKMFQSRGYEISDSPVRRHRGGGCRCAK